MRISRFFHPHPLQIQQPVLLDANAALHAVRVLRMQVGDALILFNGQGGEYSAKISHIQKHNVTVVLESFNPREAELPFTLHLGQGLARGEKMDFIIQKAVELGVTHITPLFTEFCDMKFSQERLEKKLQHWQGIIIAACEQCGRNRLPIIQPALQLQKFITTAEADYKLLLDASGERWQPGAIQHKSILIMVGPEGGFSDREVQLAREQQFTIWKLGDRILRTETAALAASAILQYIY